MKLTHSGPNLVLQSFQPYLCVFCLPLDLNLPPVAPRTVDDQFFLHLCWSWPHIFPGYAVRCIKVPLRHCHTLLGELYLLLKLNISIYFF